MVHPSQQKPPYPRREAPLRITVVRRGRTRVFAIRPWIAGSVLGVFAMLAASAVSAAAYLIYRDDLIGAAISRQVEMQYAYEERVATLRSELDQMISRHIVQSEGVEQQLATLLGRQAVIERRQSALDALLGKARSSGVAIADAGTRLPRPRPGAEAESVGPEDDPVEPLGYMPLGYAPDAIAEAMLQGGPSGGPHPGLQALLSQVQSLLDDGQAQQSQALDALGASVEGEVERLSTALSPIGVEVEGAEAEAAAPQGGPYFPTAGLHFVERAVILDRRLDDIRSLRRSAAALPLKAPLRTRRISSGFGYRIDPFLKRRAFHSGFDLVAAEGAEVRATAPGIVVIAGWNGGYGKMVEISHAGGVSTRYGHLSAALVSPGTRVAAGTPIGLVGSTGRSTGAHLHYETRRDGVAVDPAIFLAAARALD
jgi:murein DD-endopeptidase MepM/ murein hydrolase activator NlpD